MNREEWIFFGGFLAALLAMLGIATLFGGKPVVGVSCSFTSADAPKGSVCEIRAPSLVGKLLNNL